MPEGGVLPATAPGLPGVAGAFPRSGRRRRALPPERNSGAGGRNREWQADQEPVRRVAAMTETAVRAVNGALSNGLIGICGSLGASSDM